MRMFFGVISWRSGSPTCMRRQRLRRAIATERLAAPWPTMCLSSSATICLGVMILKARSLVFLALQLFDDEVAVGIDADVGGDVQRTFDDLARAEFGVVGERARRRLRERAAGADGDEVVLGLDDVAIAGD